MKQTFDFDALKLGNADAELVQVPCISYINEQIEDVIKEGDFWNGDIPEWFCYPEFEKDSAGNIRFRCYDLPEHRVCALLLLLHTRMDDKIDWFDIMLHEAPYVIMDGNLKQGMDFTVDMRDVLMRRNYMEHFVKFMEIIMCKFVDDELKPMKFQIKFPRDLACCTPYHATGTMIFMLELYKAVKDDEGLIKLCKHVKMQGYHCSLWDYISSVKSVDPEPVIEVLKELKKLSWEDIDLARWDPEA